MRITLFYFTDICKCEFIQINDRIFIRKYSRYIAGNYQIKYKLVISSGQKEKEMFRGGRGGQRKSYEGNRT